MKHSLRTFSFSMVLMVGSVAVAQPTALSFPAPAPVAHDAGLRGTAPPNDECSSVTPQVLSVPSAYTFTGNNTGATATNDGPFATPTVWHAITIGACAEVILSYCGTTPAFGNVWIELGQDCPPVNYLMDSAYNTTACADGNYTVYFTNVAPGTYWIPVLSEAGSMGPYQLTVTVLSCGGSPFCDGADVLTSDNTSTENICLGDSAGVIDFITTTTSTESYAYILADASENIVAVEPGSSIDFGALPLGIYHVHGISYNGSLANTGAGNSVTGVVSTGACFDPSSTFVTVTVESCSGVAERDAATWSVYPNPGNGDFLVRNGGTSGEVTLEVFDLEGRAVHASTVHMAAGETYTLALANKLAQGSYTLRITSGERRQEQRLMVR